MKTVFFIGAMLALVSCGSPQSAGTGASRWPLVDAPYELANDRDLEDLRDRYEALEPGDPQRPTMRQQLAAEYSRRMGLAMASAHTLEDAYDRLRDLVSLWRPGEIAGAVPTALAAELSPYAPAVQTLRKRFSRSGQDIEAATALFFLALAEPQRADAYMAELEEIFTYEDALARAQYGDGAETSRPIAILEAVAASAPIAGVVDRLIELYVVRQEIITRLFKDSDRRLGLIQAHGGGVLDTGWHIVRVLAVAGRLEEAPRHLARFTGMGQNARLTDAVEAALSPNARARDWETLAELYTEPKKKEDDDAKQARLSAALALCREGAQRFAQSAGLARCAGETAHELELTHVAIHFFEQAVARAPDDFDAANALADLYRQRVSALAFYDRPLQAEKRLTELEEFLAATAAKWPKKKLDSDLADAYASMGRGMTSLGELARARQFLQKSLALRTSMGALEQLGTLAFKEDKVTDAIKYFDRALALPHENAADDYNRARVLRLSGDALAAAKRSADASRRWHEAISSWVALDQKLDLPPEYKGELLVDAGKAQWAAGDVETALAAFDLAVDIDSDGADTHSGVISFLIVRGHYRRALDTYHRALGSYRIDAYSKVYMSLWVLAESRRSGEPPDPLLMEYLTSRDGVLWYDQLARFATGRLSLAELERRATTRGQRAEFLYYAAVLDDQRSPEAIRAAMQQVIDSGMVMFYEYDMAKYWLSEGFVQGAHAQ